MPSNLIYLSMYNEVSFLFLKLIQSVSISSESIEKLLTDKVDLDSEMSSALRQSKESEKETKSMLKEREQEVEELRQRLDAMQRRKGSPAELPVTSEG